MNSKRREGNRLSALMHRLLRTNRAREVVVIAALLLTNCGSQEFTEPPEFDGPQILFIGNSLTYTNDLPGMVAAMIDSAGAEPVLIQTLAFPNYGLEDHWVSGTRAVIADRGWDVVILQQGPSATEGRPSLLEYSLLFNDEIVDVGGKTAMYMVWPSQDRDFDFDGVSDSYQTAAQQFGGLLYPAGEAWRAAWELEPTLQLYGPDGFHPSEMGTYLAALVMFEQLTGLPPSMAPPALVTAGVGQPIEISPATADLLYAAAATANEEFAVP